MGLGNAQPGFRLRKLFRRFEGMNSFWYEKNIHQVLPSGLFGEFKWPFQGWKRDLHLGDQKVTWRKLALMIHSRQLTGHRNPKGKDRLPTSNFRGRAVSFKDGIYICAQHKNHPNFGRNFHAFSAHGCHGNKWIKFKNHRQEFNPRDPKMMHSWRFLTWQG